MLFGINGEEGKEEKIAKKENVMEVWEKIWCFRYFCFYCFLLSFFLNQTRQEKVESLHSFSSCSKHAIRARDAHIQTLIDSSIVMKISQIVFHFLIQTYIKRLLDPNLYFTPWSKLMLDGFSSNILIEGTLLLTRIFEGRFLGFKFKVWKKFLAGPPRHDGSPGTLFLVHGT